MKTLLVCVVVALVAFSTGWIVNDYYYDDKYNYDKLELYQEYYYHTENFLDTLDKYDDWVDRFDPQEYYEVRSRIDSINKY